MHSGFLSLSVDVYVCRNISISKIKQELASGSRRLGQKDYSLVLFLLIFECTSTVQMGFRALWASGCYPDSIILIEWTITDLTFVCLLIRV